MCTYEVKIVLKLRHSKGAISLCCVLVFVLNLTNEYWKYLFMVTSVIRWISPARNMNSSKESSCILKTKFLGRCKLKQVFHE